MKINIAKSYVEYSIEGDEIVIDMLYIHPEERGGHKGYELLRKVLAETEKYSLPTTLCAVPDDADFPVEKLVEYYQDFGFTLDTDSTSEFPMMTYK